MLRSILTTQSLTKFDENIDLKINENNTQINKYNQQKLVDEC